MSFYYSFVIPRIVWIAGNNGTTMQISGENKGLSCDPCHHGYCLILPASRHVSPAKVITRRIKLIGKVSVQIDVVGILSARKVFQRAALALL